MPDSRRKASGLLKGAPLQFPFPCHRYPHALLKERQRPYVLRRAAATMYLGASIFGTQFGAYSFKNYVPIIAAVVVAAVVGEIAHNAKVRRQKRDQARRISRLRQLVRKQKMRRDLALLEAEKQEREAMEKREAARRRLYRSQRIDHQWLMQVRNRQHDRFARHARLDSDFDNSDYFDAEPKRQQPTSSRKHETSERAAPKSSDQNPKELPQPPAAKSADEEVAQPSEKKSPATGLA